MEKIDNVITKRMRSSFIILSIGVLLSGLSGLSYLAFCFAYLSFTTVLSVIGAILELIALLRLGRFAQPFNFAAKAAIAILVLVSSVFMFDILTIVVPKENFETVTFVISTALSIISLLIYTYAVYNIMKGCRVLVSGGLTSSYGQHMLETFIILVLVFALFAVLSMTFFIVRENTKLYSIDIIYKVVCSLTAALSIAYSAVLNSFVCRTNHRLTSQH